ncbi:MAG: dipeptide ABC transporter ATP-binding protein [Rickettsiales bacterium]|nr:dipeptide ABC transporter ATP-binding protein [Rickettsiales bacterium]
MFVSVKNLSISFAKPEGGTAFAVKGVDFEIQEGETLALVGESGSGKSLTALSLMKLLPRSAQTKGQFVFQGEEVHTKTEREMQKIRGSRIAMIFQEPMTALNPLHTIGKQITEILERHQPLSKKSERLEQIHALLEEVGLGKLKSRLSAYPHQLSGGERQRVMIAMAIACEPELLLADEPTTAVDVTLQVQILRLLKKIQKERNLSILFITHDLKIVEQMADRVAVLKQGELIETSCVKTFFKKPKHEYSRLLLDSRPKGEPPAPAFEGNIVMSAKDVSVKFASKKNLWGKVTHWNIAANEISLEIKKGQSLGIVGESGSGKTTLAMALLHLQKASGKIVFMGEDISNFSASELQSLRSKLQIVFQDPFGSLNPRLSIGEIIGEGLRVHQPKLSRENRRVLSAKSLEGLGLSADMLDRYPHEFSGGQRQRIAIARAMILKPEIVVMDEPTSALDVTVQAQIVELLRDLQNKTGVSFLFISHDLQVVRAVCHEVIVMQAGKLVEQGSAKQIFENPKQEYTRNLVNASLGEAL